MASRWDPTSSSADLSEESDSDNFDEYEGPKQSFAKKRPATSSDDSDEAAKRQKLGIYHFKIRINQASVQ